MTEHFTLDEAMTFISVKSDCHLQSGALILTSQRLHEIVNAAVNHKLQELEAQAREIERLRNQNNTVARAALDAEEELASIKAQEPVAKAVVLTTGIGLQWIGDPLPAGTRLYTHAQASEPEPKRPINCGTGRCSCIECVMEPAPSTAVELSDWDARTQPDAPLTLGQIAIEELLQLGYTINGNGFERHTWPSHLHIVRLLAIWEDRSREASPVDAMLINKCIRELRAVAKEMQK